MSLGEKILKSRKKKGLSQEELGDKIKVTRQTISNWELGETSPNPEQLKLLSKELQVSVDELLDNDINNILVEKVSNTEKLLKIIIFVVLGIILIWLILIVGHIIIKNMRDTGRVMEKNILCNIYDETHSYSVSYEELTGQILNAGGDAYFYYILDLDKYDDANQVIYIINDYVKRNGGTCVIFENDELDDVVNMYIKENTLTNTGATIVIEEETDYDIYYGEPFTLEKYNYSNNTWEELPIICDNCGFNLPAYSATPDKPLELVQDWSRLYGNLSKGYYRIVKEANFNDSNDQYKIWAEFPIE